MPSLNSEYEFTRKTTLQPNYVQRFLNKTNENIILDVRYLTTLNYVKLCSTFS